MSPQLIKQVVLYCIVLVVLLGGWIDAWWTQHEFTKFKDNISMQVAKNEKAKQDKETQDAENIAAIAGGYSSQLDVLNKRLRDIQNMSGRTTVQLAGETVRGVTVPQKASYPGGITPSGSKLCGTCEGTEFYADSLEDAAQLNALVETVKRVCM